jgi:hypothetical protein
MHTVIQCEARQHNRGLNTDHVPIITKLDAELGRTLEAETNNFRNVDWDKFRKMLQTKMANFGIPNTIRNQVELHKECERLTHALQETIKLTVPTSDVCPKSK